MRNKRVSEFWNVSSTPQNGFYGGRNMNEKVTHLLWKLIKVDQRCFCSLQISKLVERKKCYLGITFSLWTWTLGNFWKLQRWSQMAADVFAFLHIGESFEAEKWNIGSTLSLIYYISYLGTTFSLCRLSTSGKYLMAQQASIDRSSQHVHNKKRENGEGPDTYFHLNLTNFPILKILLGDEGATRGVKMEVVCSKHVQDRLGCWHELYKRYLGCQLK